MTPVLCPGDLPESPPPQTHHPRVGWPSLPRVLRSCDVTQSLNTNQNHPLGIAPGLYSPARTDLYYPESCGAFLTVPVRLLANTQAQADPLRYLWGGFSRLSFSWGGERTTGNLSDPHPPRASPVKERHRRAAPLRVNLIIWRKLQGLNSRILAG